MTIRMLCQALAFSIISAGVCAQSAPKKATPKSSNEPIDIVIGENDAAARPRTAPAETPSLGGGPTDTASQTQQREELKSVIDQKKNSANPTDRALGKMMEDFFNDVDTEIQGSAAINREIGTVKLSDLDSQSKLLSYQNRVQQHANKLKNAESKIQTFQGDLRRKLEMAGVRGEELDSAEGKIIQSTNALRTKIQVLASYPEAIAILDKHWGQWAVDPNNPTMPVFDKRVPAADVAKFKATITSVHQLSGGQ